MIWNGKVGRVTLTELNWDAVQLPEFLMTHHPDYGTVVLVKKTGGQDRDPFHIYENEDSEGKLFLRVVLTNDGKFNATDKN